MKTATKILLSIVLFAASLVGASAQVAGVYTLLPGGTTVVPVTSTNVVWTYPSTNSVSTNSYSLPGSGPAAANTNLWIMPVAEFDYAGLTWGFTGTATSTNSLLIYRSYDNGQTYETTAGFSYGPVSPGANAWLTNASLDVHGVTTLAITLRSPGTTLTTNHLLEFNLKSAKVGAKPATR